MSTPTVSYCCECDAPLGECEHTGRRYLAPIKYELIGGSTPRDWRWKAPDHERWRLDNPQSSWPQAAPQRAEADIPPVPHLVVKLDGWVEMDDELEGMVRAAYERDPRQTFRLIATTCEKAERRELRNPRGWLVASLRKQHLT